MRKAKQNQGCSAPQLFQYQVGRKRLAGISLKLVFKRPKIVSGSNVSLITQKVWKMNNRISLLQHSPFVFVISIFCTCQYIFCHFIFHLFLLLVSEIFTIQCSHATLVLEVLINFSTFIQKFKYEHPRPKYLYSAKKMKFVTPLGVN